MKNLILKALVVFGLISFSFKAGQSLLVTQPDKPTSTIIFYSRNLKEATERTKMYVKQGYIIKSFNIADDANTGVEWTHAVVILEKY
jgi:hypothetical protein